MPIIKLFEWLKSVFKSSYARFASFLCLCAMIGLGFIGLLRTKEINMWDCAIIALFGILALLFYYSGKVLSIKKIQAGGVDVEFESIKAGK